jgi:hypothetical protein
MHVPDPVVSVALVGNARENQQQLSKALNVRVSS